MTGVVLRIKKLSAQEQAREIIEAFCTNHDGSIDLTRIPKQIPIYVRDAVFRLHPSSLKKKHDHDMGTRAFAKLCQESTLAAFEAISEVLNDPDAFGGTRLQAATIIINRGTKKESLQYINPIEDLAKMSADDAMSAILTEVAAGSLSLEHADALTKLIESRQQLALGPELVRRLDALEQLANGRRPQQQLSSPVVEHDATEGQVQSFSRDHEPTHPTPLSPEPVAVAPGVIAVEDPQPFAAAPAPVSSDTTTVAPASAVSLGSALLPAAESPVRPSWVRSPLPPNPNAETSNQQPR